MNKLNCGILCTTPKQQSQVGQSRKSADEFPERQFRECAEHPIFLRLQTHSEWGWLDEGVKARLIRILIADDHEMMRKVTIRILQSRPDIECAEARNGQEAVEKALELKPDLIVLDISMPAVDGFDAAREIKQHLPDVPILFFSIYDDVEYVDAARSIGEGVVLKDEAGTTLLQAVDALLKKHKFFPNTGSTTE